MRISFSALSFLCDHAARWRIFGRGSETDRLPAIAPECGDELKRETSQHRVTLTLRPWEVDPRGAGKE
jgi:hypothetical protein